MRIPARMSAVVKSLNRVVLFMCPAMDVDYVMQVLMISSEMEKLAKHKGCSADDLVEMLE